MEYPNLLNTPEQVKKINHTLKELNTMTIYKYTSAYVENECSLAIKQEI
ncbi:hypothetical protein HMPREF9303_0082 [Prevotella denticola CRIS 18C-A]|uniref:Uncharacterized protein n=1 Tax=Prevotella denticola CRIS 18C-A TaxID=944557 RepID=F0HAK9_9BACT|nr:hypothetical protein HMPREF9303_0082 [Prevotella denticola CRIS 18C-A]